MSKTIADYIVNLLEHDSLDLKNFHKLSTDWKWRLHHELRNAMIKSEHKLTLDILTIHSYLHMMGYVLPTGFTPGYYVHYYEFLRDQDIRILNDYGEIPDIITKLNKEAKIKIVNPYLQQFVNYIRSLDLVICTSDASSISISWEHWNK